MKIPITIFQKILLVLLVAMLLIMLGDLLIQYLFDISIEVGRLMIPLLVVGIVSLYAFISRKKLLVFVFLCIIASAVLIYFNVTKDSMFGSSRMISDSEYGIEVSRHGYSIIKYYDFAEKVIAAKKTDIFFDPDSKKAVDIGYQVKVIKETPDSLYIEINSSRYKIDSLKKRNLWSRH